MISRFLAAFVAALGLGAATSGVAQNGAAQHQAPVFDRNGETSHRATLTFGQEVSSMPFELHRGNRVFIKGSVNGNATPIMLDTGASVTAIDREFARSIGLKAAGKTSISGAGGAVDAEIASGVDLQIGSTHLKNVAAVIMDLQPIARALGRALPVVLGTDLFDRSVVGIDWAGQRLSIMNPATFKPAAGATEVKLGRIGPFRSIPLSVMGLPPIDAVLDLGNGGTISLPSDYWQKQPELTGIKSAQGFSGGVGGVHEVRRVTLARANVAGTEFSVVPATLGRDSNGGHSATAANVGIEMLKAFDVTLDLGRSRLWLKPLAAQPSWNRERLGAMVQLDGDRLKVIHVSRDGPAAAAGVKAGDEIVSIDGQAVDSNFYAGALADWNRRPAGTMLKLMRSDGTIVNVTLRDYY